MLGLVIIGLISLTAGYLYLFRPESIIRLSRIADRLISTDHQIIRHRTASGIAMLVAGCLIFYVGIYYL